MDKNNFSKVRCIRNSSVGVDVHNKSLVCVYQKYDSKIGDLVEELAKFKTSDSDLKKFSEWCSSKNPEIIMLESTGVYWVSCVEALEDAGFSLDKIAVVKASDLKAVRATSKKTDKIDAYQLADYARMGLFKPSFILTKDFRYIRQIGREYTNSLKEVREQKNRVHKCLSRFGCRVGLAFSKINGKTAVETTDAYIDKSFDAFKQVVYNSRTVKATRKQIIDAYNPCIKKDEKKLLRIVCDELKARQNSAEKKLNLLKKVLKPYETQIELLTSISGINTKLAMLILSEIGPDVNSFVNSAKFSCWCGVSPCTRNSAGRNISTRISKGNTYLKSYLVEAAENVMRLRVDHSELRKAYQSFRENKGHRCAIIATAHKLAKIIFSVMKNKTAYVEQYNYTLAATRVKKYCRDIRNLNELGLI